MTDKPTSHLTPCLILGLSFGAGIALFFGPGVEAAVLALACAALLFATTCALRFCGQCATTLARVSTQRRKDGPQR